MKKSPIIFTLFGLIFTSKGPNFADFLFVAVAAAVDAVGGAAVAVADIAMGVHDKNRSLYGTSP